MKQAILALGLVAALSGVALADGCGGGGYYGGGYSGGYYPVPRHTYGSGYGYYGSYGSYGSGYGYSNPGFGFTYYGHHHHR